MEALLGIPISSKTQNEVQANLETFLSSGKAHQIVTVNPEMLVAASRDPEFAELLNSTDLNTADGFGIALLSKSITERTTGNDLTRWLLKLAARHQRKICFLGGEGDQAIRAARRVNGKIPSLRILAEPAGQITFDQGWQMDPELIDRLNAFQPDILLVGLGHKKQEFWIRDHLARLPSVRVAVGVGGVLAFLSGDIQRAPKWMQKIGLEWLWRLMQEPSRLGRIFTAVVIFPSLMIFDRIRSL